VGYTSDPVAKKKKEKEKSDGKTSPLFREQIFPVASQEQQQDSKSL